MPVTIRAGYLNVKDEHGSYIAPEVVSLTERSTAEQIEAIESAGLEQINAVEEKGEETLESIPEDYTELSEEVADLKSSFGTMVPDPPTMNGAYVLTARVIDGVVSYAWESTN